MASRLSTSSKKDWSGASLLLATDIAGALHCYVYVTGNSPSLQHLWTRRLDGSSDEDEAAEASHNSGISRFQCALSKRLSRLCSTIPSTKPTKATAKSSPYPVAGHAPLEQLPTAYASEGPNVFDEVRIPPSTEKLSSLPPSSATGKRFGGGTRQPSQALSAKTTNDDSNRRTVSSTVTKTAGTPPSAASPVSCPFCAAASLSSLLSVAGSANPATAISFPHSSRSTTTENEEVICCCSDTRDEHSKGFQCSDFMARVPNLFFSSKSNATGGYAAPFKAVHSKPAASLAEGSAAVVATDAPRSEIDWYWRCPQRVLRSDTTAANPTTEEERGALWERSLQTWIPLSKAARHWNRRCCRRHRLLLLRKMDETYTELNLFTGELLSTTGSASDLLEAGSFSSANSVFTDENLPLTRSGNADTSSSSASSSQTRADPAAVLSLTIQRHQTLLVQAPTSLPNAKNRKEMRNGKPANVTLSAGGAATTPTCLLKLTAPTVHFAVAWYPPEVSAAGTDASEQSSKDGKKDEKCIITASKFTVVRRSASAHSSSASSSDHGSTSASDIDMDVLSGRKRLPPRYHSPHTVRHGHPGSASSSASSSSSESNPLRLHARKTGKSAAAAGAGDTHNVGEADDGVPVRCGRGGDVYVAETFRGRPHSELGGDEEQARQQPILQLPVPLVQAVWIRLASSSYIRSDSTLEGDADGSDGTASQKPSAAGASSTSLPVSILPVPWLAEQACALHVVDGGHGVRSPRLQGPSTTASAAVPKTAATKATTATASTLRGFLLRTVRTDIITGLPSPSLEDYPRVLRDLSILDLLHGRASNFTDQHLCGRALVAFDSNSVSREHTEGVRTPHRGVSPSSTSGTYFHTERSTHGRQYRKGYVKREAPRDFHRGEQRDSSVSSPTDDGGIAQRIAPLPPHFVPSSSFFDENFEPLTMLGRGVGGAVLLTRHRVTGVFYAVKILVARDYESERDILQEVRVHAMLESKHVVRYHACWSEVITATRAQQLAFIGVCHTHEANGPRRPRLPAPQSAPALHDDYWYGRSVSGDRSSSLGRTSRAPHTAWSSEEERTRRAGVSRMRSAPGGWDRLILPSHSSVMLIGSESVSESVSPVTTVMRPNARLRSAPGSSAIMDEYAGDEDEVEDSVADDSSDSGTARGHVNLPLPNSQRSREKGCEGRQGKVGLRHNGAFHRATVGHGSATARDKKMHRGASGSAGDFTDTSPSSRSEESSDPEGESDDMGTESCERSGQSGDHTIIGSRVVFLQMEFCQVTLAHYLSSRASINRIENLVILLQIVSGLRYLQSRGVLHRDLKPTNVFMDYRCQYDKIVHSPNSSSASSSSSSENERGGNDVWAIPSVASLQQSDEFSRGRDSLNHSFSPCTALSIHRQRTLPLKAQGAAHDNGNARSLANLHPVMDPVTTFQLNSKHSSLDNLPSWDGGRSALDVVLHTSHQGASVLLQERLSRRPPPHTPGRQEPEAHAAPPPAETPTEHAADGCLVLHHEGKVFLQHLARWLCQHFVQVRLGDFGLAKFLCQQDIHVGGFVSMNATNTVGVGSPLYSSPEQLKGNRCTPASDVFSVGVIMAEMYLQPKTIAERLTVLREVRDGVYHDTELMTRYPELKLVRRLTVAQPEGRITLAAAQTALKATLLKALQQEVSHHCT
ncbi:putative protein kinase [Leptomonas seymouri]|uniref:Protein kinase domain-containing protein n=1 Tax=Leptomonas seymouri TaxID=5684 RepID=A0A0N1IBX3_LEPSE|nr:putative protein kinase [Leptomonas seymouri]|eukprot:KPI90372.1 putative protein kinase [Leptomonas seymouri]